MRLAIAFATLTTLSALAADGPPADLVKLFGSKSPADRAKAVATVAAEKSPDPESVRLAYAACADPSPKVATPAAAFVEKRHPDLHKHLVTILVDENLRNRRNSIQLLAEEGQNARPITGFLARLVSYGVGPNANPDAIVVGREAAAALRRIGHFPPDVCGPLKAAAAKGVDESLRTSALRALATAWAADAGLSKDLVPLFRPALGAKVATAGVIQMVGGIGPNAKDLLPAVAALKLSPDMAVREAAIEAAKNIDK